MRVLQKLWEHSKVLQGQETDRGEPGQGLAEYALILTFVALVCITALTALGVGISGSPGFSMFP